jgi:hypothetical protein
MANAQSTTSQPSEAPPRRRRGRGKPFQPGENSASRLEERRLAIVADLSAQVVEVNGGKAPTPSQAVLIGQIVRLQLAKTGDLVRQSRAIADMLVQLGVSSLRPPLPSMPVVPTLQDYLRQRATEAAGASESSGGGTLP